MMVYILQFWDEWWDRYIPYSEFGEFGAIEDAKACALKDSGKQALEWWNEERNDIVATIDSHTYYIIIEKQP